MIKNRAIRHRIRSFIQALAPLKRRFRQETLAGLSLAILGALAASSSYGQGEAFTNLISVETKQIGNGVRVEFNFDGTFRFNPTGITEWADFNRNGDPFNSVREIRFRISNARTQAGAFFDVSRYPVSHVELSIPPGAADGVGLDATVVLTQPAKFGGLNVGGDEWCCWDTFPPSFNIRDSQDRRKLIVTVLSDRLPEQPETRRSAEDAARFSNDLSVTNFNGLLSVRALNAPLSHFAQALSEATGASIAVDDAVSRYVQMNLPATTLDETLDLLSRTYNLAISENPTDASIQIGDGSPLSGSRIPSMTTGYIPLNNIPAINAADLFPDFLRRYLRPDSEKNVLVVTGTPSLVNKVRSDAAKIDQPVPQIELEVIATEISSDDSLSSALQAGTDQKSFNLKQGPNEGDISFSTVNATAADWEARIDALASQDKVRILSKTKLRIQNGEDSTLFVGDQKMIQIQRMDWDGWTYTELMSVQTGARLEATPWTGGDGNVTIKLQPSFSFVVSRDPATGLPTIDNRTASSILRTHDGDVIMIGGLKQRSQYDTTKKIPLLGSLPLIGKLFRWKEKTKTDVDLVLFVMPRVVRSTGAFQRDIDTHLIPLIGG